MNLRQNPDGSYDLAKPRRWQAGYYITWKDNEGKVHYCYMGERLEDFVPRLEGHESALRFMGSRIVPRDRMWRYKDDQEESKLPWED